MVVDVSLYMSRRFFFSLYDDEVQVINYTQKKKTVVGVLQASSSCGRGGENPVSAYVHVLVMCLA